MPRGPDPYPRSPGNLTGAQTPKGSVWQEPIPEHCHPVFIKFMAMLLQKCATPYCAKILIVGNKTVRDSPKFGGNLQGNRDMCMHNSLTKLMNTNCSFYHAQAKEMDAQYTANIFKVLAP